MSRFDASVRQQLPAGVVFRPLSDIASTVAGLSGKTKADFTGGSARYVTYKSVYASPEIDEQAAELVSIGQGEKQNMLRRGDIVFTGSSENFEDVGMTSVVLAEPSEPLYLNSFCFVLRFNQADAVLPEFSKYLFRSEPVRKQIRRAAAGVTRINISKARLMQIKIPVPLIKVQQEIVRVLDYYSSLQTELAKDLEAEMKARRQQYQYLVHQIVSTIDAGHEALRDLGVWRGGVTPSKSEPRYWTSGTIPWLASMDVSESEARTIRGRITPLAIEETSLQMIPATSVVVVMRSNILRNRLPVGLTAVEATVNQDIRALVARDDVDSEYVFQILRASSEEIRMGCVRTDGSMAAMDSKAFLDWEIPLPHLADQSHIAKELRALDGAVTELGSSLSAEVAGRRRQYDHCRDTLLTFDEAVA